MPPVFKVQPVQQECKALPVFKVLLAQELLVPLVLAPQAQLEPLVFKVQPALASLVLQARLEQMAPPGLRVRG